MLSEQIKKQYKIQFPFSSTLFLRVAKASENAQRIAEELTAQQHVIKVMYPGLVDHPGHDVAIAQMDGGFGPLVSFRVANEHVAKRVVAAMRLFRNATSLGGVEGLVEHRAPVEGLGTPVPSDLIRLSLGIEDVGDLVADLKQALQHPLR